MKKAMYFMVIAMLIVACQPNNEVNTPFEKGQKVILSATLSSGSTGAQQLPGKQRVSGKDNTTDIKLTWDKGDQILVAVGGETSIFTLIGDGGNSYGEFEGTMPGTGSTYTVTYPATYNEDVLTNQTYVENGFGNGLLSMSGSGTLDDGFTLTAQNAVLELSLKGSGNMGRIVVSDKTNSKTYTLDCNGVTLDASAKSFYMVVPAGNWKFKAEVYDDHSPKPTETFETSSTITFTAGEDVTMPTQEALLAYDLKTLTFEDNSEPFTEYNLGYVDLGAGKDITTWSDLIDDLQIGGALLYNSWMDMDEPYWWHDDNNTKLTHTMPDCGGFTYMYGGMAISNYTSEDYNFDHYTDGYNHQLEVYGTIRGDNFVMTNCGFGLPGEPDPDATVPSITFVDVDEEARVIDHMYINNGTYALAGFESILGEDGWMKVVAIGLYGGNVTDRAEILLYDGSDNIITKWTKWDLSVLGKVEEVKFYVISSDTSGSFGAYCFAYDDVAVRFPTE